MLWLLHALASAALFCPVHTIFIRIVPPAYQPQGGSRETTDPSDKRVSNKYWTLRFVAKHTVLFIVKVTVFFLGGG